ncbi:MAG: DNA-binding protein, partial [Cyanobacteria bacterium PR.023]|nr:DNA-binding protein [Cyanobacteria bacterium PR.023]
QDLTTSAIARSNVLNNHYALSKLQSHLELGGLNIEGEVLFFKAHVAELLDIDERTIDRYLASHEEELKQSGYRVLRGQALKNMKLAQVDDINVVDLIGAKVPSLGVFSFRALLNMAMLVTESERAKSIRSRMLDIVLDVVAERVGGHTRFINQRDQDYLPSAFMEESYRKQFTNALRDHVDMGKHKYAVFTDKIYQAVFCENAREYKQVLRLADGDKTRDTMYAEVLKTLASFESGLAARITEQAEVLGRKLKAADVDQLLAEAANSPFLKPLIEDARTRMASRDLGFREALHHKLETYIQAVPQADFERFLGESSRALEERLSDPKLLAVLRRLKDR